MITDSDLTNFINDRVCLKQERANQYRSQVNTLRERLASFIKDNPEFDLIKMLHSGSVAKGTALSTLNDMDVAVYIKPDNIENYEIFQVLEYIRDALRKVYEGLMEPEQFSLGTHCVRVDFRGSGLDVEVVPVIYRGKLNDRGELLNRDTGKWVETSIPLHLEFIRARKDSYPLYADMVRLTKWWKNERDFKFKSFAIELIWAYLVDTVSLPETPIDALATFFAYILRTRLRERIIFSDYYKASDVKKDAMATIQIYDPVNPENNVGETVEEHLIRVLDETQLAFDALSMAKKADTKGRSIELWQRIIGTSFNP